MRSKSRSRPQKYFRLVRPQYNHATMSVFSLINRNVYQNTYYYYNGI